MVFSSRPQSSSFFLQGKFKWWSPLLILSLPMQSKGHTRLYNGDVCHKFHKKRNINKLGEKWVKARRREWNQSIRRRSIFYREFYTFMIWSFLMCKQSQSSNHPLSSFYWLAKSCITNHTSLLTTGWLMMVLRRFSSFSEQETPCFRVGQIFKVSHAVPLCRIFHHLIPKMTSLLFWNHHEKLGPETIDPPYPVFSYAQKERIHQIANLCYHW